MNKIVFQPCAAPSMVFSLPGDTLGISSLLGSSRPGDNTADGLFYVVQTVTEKKRWTTIYPNLHPPPPLKSAESQRCVPRPISETIMSPPPMRRCLIPLTTHTTSFVTPPPPPAAALFFEALAGEDLSPKGNSEPCAVLSGEGLFGLRSPSDIRGRQEVYTSVGVPFFYDFTHLLHTSASLFIRVGGKGRGGIYSPDQPPG